MTDEARCSACRFHWDGECRRHAPAPVVPLRLASPDENTVGEEEPGATRLLTDRTAGGALWPFVNADDWCGDFDEVEP